MMKVLCYNKMKYTKDEETIAMLCDMIDSKENLSKFQRIYEKYKNTMYSVAYDIIKNSQDAEDIVETSLIKVIDILDNIDDADIDRSRCKNLMITITKNAAIDCLRKNVNGPVPYDNIETRKLGKSAEELFIEMESYREVILCIDQMDEKHREVLRLRILHHLNSKEIGKILNINEYNVNVRFMRAKQILAKKLKEHQKNEKKF